VGKGGVEGWCGRVVGEGVVGFGGGGGGGGVGRDR